VDIGQGLGEKVIMMDASVGGFATAWSAKNRSNIYLAIIISPVVRFW
jgi:hypothetical protein